MHRLAPLHPVTEMLTLQARRPEHQRDAAVVFVVGRANQRHPVPQCLRAKIIAIHLDAAGASDVARGEGVQLRIKHVERIAAGVLHRGGIGAGRRDGARASGHA